MSKKDYQAIALAIHEVRAGALMADLDVLTNSIVTGVIGAITDNIAHIMSADNGNFDRARFIEACETGTTRGMRKVSA